jgi:hypothetical protein
VSCFSSLEIRLAHSMSHCMLQATRPQQDIHSSKRLWASAAPQLQIYKADDKLF